MTHTRPAITCFMLALITGLSHAFAQEIVRHGPTPPRARLSSPRIEVPMDLSTRHPVIELTLNDQGPYRFVVDSGAGGTMIDDDLARALDLPKVGIARTGDASGHAPKEMPLTHIERIEIGDAMFLGNDAVIGDLDALWHDQKEGARGILAFSTFTDCLVTYDYLNNKLILEEGSLPPADGKDIVAFTFDHRIPVIPLTIAGVPLHVTLDTGAALAGVLAADLEGKIPLKSPPVPVGKARRMNTTAIVREARIDGAFRLGRHKVKEPIFHFMGVRSVIGHSIFKHFAVTFDQKNKLVRFTRPDDAPITFGPRYTAGFGAKPTAAGHEVWYVIEGLPAAAAGLKEGDLIITANGQPAATFDPPAWRDLFERSAPVILELRRGETTQTLTIHPNLAVP